MVSALAGTPGVAVVSALAGTPGVAAVSALAGTPGVASVSAVVFCHRCCCCFRCLCYCYFPADASVPVFSGVLASADVSCSLPARVSLLFVINCQIFLICQ